MKKQTIYNLLKALLSILLFLFTSANTVNAQGGGAVVGFSPEIQSVKLNESLSATILLDTHGVSINGVLLEITYPKHIIVPRNIDQTETFLGLWYQQNFLKPGQIVLEAETTGSGVSGDKLTVATINFNSVKIGTADLVFSPNSKVYRASDHQNILIEARSVSYSVTEKTPTPVPTYGGPTPVASVSLKSPTPTSIVESTSTPIPITTTNPTSLPSPTSPPQQPSQNRFSSIVLVIGSLFVGVFLSAGVYYLINRFKHSKQNTHDQTKPTLSSEQTDENSENSTN